MWPPGPAPPPPPPCSLCPSWPPSCSFWVPRTMTVCSYYSQLTPSNLGTNWNIWRSISQSPLQWAHSLVEKQNQTGGQIAAKMCKFCAEICPRALGTQRRGSLKVYQKWKWCESNDLLSFGKSCLPLKMCMFFLQKRRKVNCLFQNSETLKGNYTSYKSLLLTFSFVKVIGLFYYLLQHREISG